MSWKIFYAKGTTFSSADGAASAAPHGGVAVIAEKREGESHILKYGELYACFSQMWHTAFVRRKSWAKNAVILYGEMMPAADFRAALLRAAAWLEA